MRILFLHSSSDLYGASKILFTTIKFCKEKHVVCVVLSEEGPLADALRLEGVEVFIIRLGILRRKYFSLPGLWNRLVVMLAAKRSISKLVKEKNIDLVYSNTAGVLVGAFVAKSCNVNHLWHIHEIIAKPRWFSKYIGWMLDNFSDKVVVVSEAVHKHWHSFIKEKSKIRTIYNGIDYNPYLDGASSLRGELMIDESIVIIGMVGRVHFWKGQEYFLRLAGQIIRKYSHVHFVMIGDVFPGYEYLYEELKKVKEEEGLSSCVTDLGFRSDIPQLMKGFDIFVSPSILPDPLPTVILEAMASAIPVIATNHGGSTEMVDNGVTGILIPWDNPEEATRLFEELIVNRGKRVSMGVEGRKRVLTNFSLSNYKEKILRLLEEIDGI